MGLLLGPHNSTCARPNHARGDQRRPRGPAEKRNSNKEMKKGAIHGRREKPITTKVVIGESEQGSPILYQDHDYNISSKSV